MVAVVHKVLLYLAGGFLLGPLASSAQRWFCTSKLCTRTATDVFKHFSADFEAALPTCTPTRGSLLRSFPRRWSQLPFLLLLTSTCSLPLSLSSDSFLYSTIPSAIYSASLYSPTTLPSPSATLDPPATSARLEDGAGASQQACAARMPLGKGRRYRIIRCATALQLESSFDDSGRTDAFGMSRGSCREDRWLERNSAGSEVAVALYKSSGCLPASSRASHSPPGRCCSNERRAVRCTSFEAGLALAQASPVHLRSIEELRDAGVYPSQCSH